MNIIGRAGVPLRAVWPTPAGNWHVSERHALQLLEAASLAAYFSKARKSSKVPVIYTQVKYVRKQRKFPPGKVIVEREKQLMVKPGDPGDFGREEEQ